MVTESKGTTVVAGLIHKGPTVSYRYTTLVDATPRIRNSAPVQGQVMFVCVPFAFLFQEQWN